MKRDQRLRRTEDFRRARERAARPWSHPLVVLYAAPNDLERSRVGVTTSRRIGNAVVRNRVRRRLREAARLVYPAMAPGRDLVFIARAASADATWPSLRDAVAALVERAGLSAPAAASD